jgi:hypothetical protein
MRFMEFISPKAEYKDMFMLVVEWNHSPSLDFKGDMKCTHNVILRNFHVTIVTMKKP